VFIDNPFGMVFIDNPFGRVGQGPLRFRSSRIREAAGLFGYLGHLGVSCSLFRRFILFVKIPRRGVHGDYITK